MWRLLKDLNVVERDWEQAILKQKFLSNSSNQYLKTKVTSIKQPIIDQNLSYHMFPRLWKHVLNTSS